MTVWVRRLKGISKNGMPGFAHQIKMVTACIFAQQPLLVNLNKVKYVVLYFKSSSNFFAVEISTVHVVDINLYAILVQEQLRQHWAFSCNTNRWYWRDCTGFDEHALFKALTFVFTSSVAAVLDYNSPKCHNC